RRRLGEGGRARDRGQSRIQGWDGVGSFLPSRLRPKLVASCECSVSGGKQAWRYLEEHFREPPFQLGFLGWPAFCNSRILQGLKFLERIDAGFCVRRLQF